MRLMREVRFSVGPAVGPEPATNSWGGWPTASGIQPYLRLRACVEGQPDPLTGYICNITHIDRLLRDRANPLIGRMCAPQDHRSPTSEEVGHGEEGGQKSIRSVEAMVLALARELWPHAPAGTRWSWWELWITPYLRYRAAGGDLTMLQITQSFEFAAAHRLHCPSLSDRENREIFGKCNHPHGHGHNYQLEVTVAGEPDARSGALIPVVQFEGIVKSRVIDRFDHKHLNEDCPEFERVNPSVENITRVIWSLLDGQFAPAQLARVRVWETSKTYAECEGIVSS